MPSKKRITSSKKEQEFNDALKDTRSSPINGVGGKDKLQKHQNVEEKSISGLKDGDKKRNKRNDRSRGDGGNCMSNETSNEVSSKLKKKNDMLTTGNGCIKKRKVKSKNLDQEGKNDIDGECVQINVISDQKSELQPWPQRKKMEDKNPIQSQRNKNRNCGKAKSSDKLLYMEEKRQKLMGNKTSHKTKRSDDLEDFEPSKKPKLELKDGVGGKRKSVSKQDVVLLNTLKEKKEKRKSTNSVKNKEPLYTENEDVSVSDKKKRKLGNDEPKEKQRGRVKSKKKGIARKKINDFNIPSGNIEVMSDNPSEEELGGSSKCEIIDSQNQIQTKPKVKVDMGDVTSVLLMMEGNSKDQFGNKAVPGPSGIQKKDDELMEDSSEEEESDWEEVEALQDHDSPKKSQIPSGPIEITLDAPELIKRRKKKSFDIKAYFQRLANRFEKEQRENIHKVHLMCLLCRGMYVNRLLDNDLLRAQALSVLPHQFTSVPKHQYTPMMLCKVLTWFQTRFPFMTNHDKHLLNLRESIGESFRLSTVVSHLERALVLIILLRSLGLVTRIVMSLQPFPLKPTIAKVFGRQASSKKKPINSKKKPSKVSKGKEKKTSVKNTKNKNAEEETKSQYFKDQDKSLRSRGLKVKPKSYKDSEEDLDSKDEFIPGSDDGDGELVVDYSNGKRKKSKGRRKEPKTPKTKNENTGSDEDFEDEQFTPRSPVTLVKNVIARSKNRKILSDDSDVEEINGGDTWTEVYLEKEDQWYCISSLSGTMMKPHVIESQATKPVQYVYGFDNDGYIKDVTPRYASKWLTETRKLRVNSDWLEETIEPYKCPDSDLHLKENNAIQAKLVSQPMPTSVSELKNHPLYVLKRHLLKFEAIYPNSAIPVGYIKNEPVYARECVHVLHSRENWLKEGRAVRVGEDPYKMVKSRARWNRKKENPDALDLETFGYWQTEEYIPPPAYNGKVPRNGYGNIELFKLSMLPAGSVHLRLPGLNKVAKKLDIDCVPAMTGWDTHCGYSHPILDGFVVCEEFKDLLIAAWDEDQEIQKQREAEKREKRVIQNWTLLTKGLLIKERLKRKYLLQSHLQESTEKSNQETGCGEKADDVSLAWPMNKAGSEALSNAKHFKSETM